VPIGVGARHAQQWFGAEGRVGQVVVESHHDAGHGVQVLGAEHVARYFQRIGLLAGRESKGVVAQGVVFVVIADGVAEVNSIGHVGLQCILQFHDYFLALGGNVGHFQLWR